MHEGELLLMRDGVPVDAVRAPAIIGESVVLAGRVPEASRRPVTMRAVELCTLWLLPLPRLRLLMDRCPHIEDAVVAEFKAHVARYAARARRSDALDGSAGFADMLAQVEAAASDRQAELAHAAARRERSPARRHARSPSSPAPRRAPSPLLPRAVAASPFERPSAGLPESSEARSAVLAAADAERFGDDAAAAESGASPLSSGAPRAVVEPRATWPAPAAPAHAPLSRASTRQRSSLGRAASISIQDRAYGTEAAACLRHAASDRDASHGFLVGEFARSLRAARAKANARGGGLQLVPSLADEYVRLEAEEEARKRREGGGGRD
jgi:hypothetical protein